MGMDVTGVEPTSPEGKEFYANIWLWHPLARYCKEVAPEITLGCERWHTNDGDGLNGEESIKLADVLEKEIAAGRATAWSQKIQTEDEKEWAATPPALKAEFEDMRARMARMEGQPDPGPLTTAQLVGRVQDFAKFLRASGGFRIW